MVLDEHAAMHTLIAMRDMHGSSVTQEDINEALKKNASISEEEAYKLSDFDKDVVYWYLHYLNN